MCNARLLNSARERNISRHNYPIVVVQFAETNRTQLTIRFGERDHGHKKGTTIKLTCLPGNQGLTPTHNELCEV